MSMSKVLLIALCVASLSTPMAASAGDKAAGPTRTQVVITMPASSTGERSAAELDEDVKLYGEREAKSSKRLGKYEGGYWYYIVTPLGLVLIIVVVWLLIR